MGKSTLAQFRPSGFVADLPAIAVPPENYTGVTNMLFRGGIAERWKPGANMLLGATTPAVIPRHLLAYTLNNTAYWFYAGNSGSGAEKIYRSVGSGTDTDVSHAGWGTYRTGANIYTSCVLQSVPVINNGTDYPAYYDGSVFKTLPDTTGGGTTAAWTCRAIRAYRYHLIAMDCTDSGTRHQDKVKWSTAAAAGAIPSDWLTAATNEAGSNYLADNRGEIVDGYQLGESFLIYKRECVYEMTYVGGVQVMAFRPLLTQIGALSRNCVVAYEGSHIVLGDNDVVKIDPGGGTESLLTRRLARRLFGSLDQSRLQGAFGVYNRQQSEIWFYLPPSSPAWGTAYPWDGACTTVLTIDTKTGDCGLLDLSLPNGAKYPAHAITGIVPTSAAVSWSGATGTWTAPDISTWDTANYSAGQVSLVTAYDGANAAGSLVYVEERGTVDTVTTFSTISREDLDFGAPDKVKLVTQVWPRVTDYVGVIDCYIGSRMAAGDATDWSGPFSYTVGTDKWIDCLVKGRFLSFSFSAQSTVGASGSWRMHGFDVTVQLEDVF